MPFADWDIYTSGVMTIDETTDNAISDTKSLRVSVGDVATRANGVPKTSSTLPQPSLKGKLTQLVRPVTLGGGRFFGLMSMQSARNVTTSGSAYLAVLDGTQVLLAKIASGISGSFVTLGSASAFVLSAATNYAIELEWDASDQAGAGGTQLWVRAGLATNLTALTEYVVHTDTSGPLTTTLGEGWFFKTPTFPTAVDARYDNTQIYRAQ